jgi:glycerol-3-phosphate dehydrogenase
MRRDIARLESESFDLLVIGGGIHGAAIAWDASLRNLRVALVEQRDFCSGTTGNSLRIAHGGLRALHQLAIGKLRESAREQAILFRIASSHVQPLPCLVPIYQNSAQGRAAFRAAFTSSRLFTADITRRFNSPLPSPRVVSRDEALTVFPGYETGDLVGGALWYDAQVPDIERLVLAFLQSAAEAGASVANHVRARRLLLENGQVTGAEVTDQLNGQNLQIRARVVVNAAGPWAPEIAESARTSGVAGLPRRWAQGVNIIVNRPPPPVAIGIRSPWGAERDPVVGGHRYLFMTGWKGVTLAGTSYRFTEGSGPSLPAQVRELVEEWNAACPSLGWNGSEVSHHHCGRLPLREGLEPGRPTALLDRSLVVNHGRHGLRGLLTVVGTKFTTARRLAENAVDAALMLLNKQRSRCRTAEVSLEGKGAGTTELAGRVRHAIQEEMALTLEDLVLRRLGLGLVTCPPVALLGQVADIAAGELGWTSRHTDEEIKRLLGRFHSGGVTRAA